MKEEIIITQEEHERFINGEMSFRERMEYLKKRFKVIYADLKKKTAYRENEDGKLYDQNTCLEKENSDV